MVTTSVHTKANSAFSTTANRGVIRAASRSVFPPGADANCPRPASRHRPDHQDAPHGPMAVPIRIGLVIAVILLLVCLPCRSAEASSIGIWLHDTDSQWQWGPNFQPSGTTMVQIEISVFSPDIDWISPIFPWINDPPIPVDSTLVVVSGTHVSYVESDDPVFENPGELHFAFDVQPAPGHTWPTGTFQISAGGVEASAPGGGAKAAAGDYYTYWDPSDAIPPGSNADGYWTLTDAGQSRGSKLILPGKEYTALPRDREPGLWVNPGDVIQVESNDQMSLKINPGDTEYYVTNGDGISYGADPIFPSLPSAALIGAVMDQDENYTLLQRLDGGGITESRV